MKDTAMFEQDFDESLLADLDSEEFLTAIPELTKMDRCDRCGAEAYVAAQDADAFTLLFCGHHWKMHEDKVREWAIDVRDERHRLDVSKEKTVHA